MNSMLRQLGKQPWKIKVLRPAVDIS